MNQYFTHLKQNVVFLAVFDLKKHRKTHPINTKLKKHNIIRLTNIAIILRSSLLLVKLKHKNKLKKNVPGWNDYVKDLYHKARDKFLIWKNKGKQKNNKIHDDMKTSRKSFKSAFNHCKANENKIRDEKLVTCYKNKNSKDFWKEVRKKKKTDMKNTYVIEKERNPKLISENF